MLLRQAASLLEALKTRYEASVSTLRETLNWPSSDGFVDAQEQRGFFVTQVSREDLIEITHLRVLLECDALKVSIRNGDTDFEGDLVAAHHKLHIMENAPLAATHRKRPETVRLDVPSC